MMTKHKSHGAKEDEREMDFELRVAPDGRGEAGFRVLGPLNPKPLFRAVKRFFQVDVLNPKS